VNNRPPKHARGSDIFQTPPAALNVLLAYLRPGWTIWECSAGKGNIQSVLTAHGLRVIGSDLQHGQNFLTWQPEQYDAIVTNPPYSIKDEFLQRAYGLGKPFAFLLPLTALEGRVRQSLYRTYGLEVIFMDGRIDFETPSGKPSSAWFATAWFTWGLGIGQQMTFAHVEKLPLFQSEFTEAINV
jgi:hypothetical protein